MITFGIQALALTDSKFPVWYPYYGTWFVGIAVEITLLILQNLMHSPVSAFDYIGIVIEVSRICTFILLPALYFGLRNDRKQYENSDAERQSLLRKKLAPKPSSSEDSTLNGSDGSNGYGTTESTVKDSDSEDDDDNDTYEDSYSKREREAKKLIKKRLKQDGNWFTYAKGFTVSKDRMPRFPLLCSPLIKVFFPYVWPTRDKSLQVRALFVGVCLLSTNALNVLVPNQMGVMVDKLTKYNDGGEWLRFGFQSSTNPRRSQSKLLAGHCSVRCLAFPHRW